MKDTLNIGRIVSGHGEGSFLCRVNPMAMGYFSLERSPGKQALSEVISDDSRTVSSIYGVSMGYQDIQYTYGNLGIKKDIMQIISDCTFTQTAMHG